MKPQESRDFKGTVEVREGPNGPMIVGYMAVYNRPSSDMGFIESIDPAAFKKTLQEADVRGCGNHNTDWLLGRTKSGTMRLRDEPTGLWYEIDVNASDPDGQRAYQKASRGDWDGSSFTFQTVRDEWNWEASPPERRLLEVSLIEGGPCTFPSYPDATAASRALQPIAERLGKPVGDLVSALSHPAELRSLINGGTMETTEDVAVEERTDEPNEERAGKMISAANMAKIQAAYENLRDLMDVAQTEAPSDSEIGDAADMDEAEDDAEMNSRSLDVLAREVELRVRTVQAA